MFNLANFLFVTQAAIDSLKAKAENDRSDPTPEIVVLSSQVLQALGSVADSLQTIAKAQTDAVAMSKMDIQQIIDEGVKEAIAPAVDAEIQKRTARDYIGKKDT